MAERHLPRHHLHGSSVIPEERSEIELLLNSIDACHYCETLGCKRCAGRGYVIAGLREPISAETARRIEEAKARTRQS